MPNNYFFTNPILESNINDGDGRITIIQTQSIKISHREIILSRGKMKSISLLIFLVVTK